MAELNMEFGLDTFGDVTAAGQGQRLPQAQVIRNVIDEGVLADRLHIDNFGVGDPIVVINSVGPSPSGVQDWQM